MDKITVVLKLIYNYDERICINIIHKWKDIQVKIYWEVKSVYNKIHILKQYKVAPDKT